MVDRAPAPSTKRLEWVGSAVVGGSSGVSFANHLLHIWARTRAQQILILLGLTVFFGLLAYGLIFRFTTRYLASLSARVRAVWLLLCLLIGAILLLVLPVEPPLPPSRHHLEIVATGDSNPMAQGSEVWILEIQQPDGSILSPDDLTLSGDWEVRDGALLSYQNQPASAQWTGLTAEGDFTITFVSHPWSGIVEVRLDENGEWPDLYAPSGTHVPVALPARIEAGRAPDWMALAASLYAADLATLWGLLLVVSLWSAKRLEWAGSALVGTSTGLSFANHLLDIWARTPAQQILMLLGLTVLFGLLAYGLIFRFTRGRLASFGPRARAAWVLLSIMIGGVFMLVVPVEPPLPPSRHHLEIVATGDSNPMAQGSEVWILEIQRPDGSILSLDDLTLSGDWEVRDGVLVSHQSQPAAAEWSDVSTGSDFAITVVSHPWSGVVEVRLDGREQRLDLYATSGSHMPLTFKGSSQVAGAAALYGADLVTLAALVLVATVWLVTRSAGHEGPVDVPRWSWVYYALPCASIWTVWLLIFWPGLMSNDSLDQWGQMLSGDLNDMHPAFHTMTNWLITRLWLSPAAVAFAQILALSSVVSWGLTLIRRLGAPRRVVWTISAVFALSPLYGIMVITVWKDIPYGIALLALTLLVLEIVTSDGAWLSRRTRWMMLGGVGALVALYRHNGPAAALGTLVVLLVVYRQRWPPLLAALLLAVGLWLGMRGPVYRVLGVEGAPRWLELVPLTWQVGAHLSTGTPLRQEEASFLTSIRPVADHWRYSCYSVHPTLFDGQFGFDAVEASPGRFVQIWWTLAMRNPRAILDHLACASSFMWRVKEPTGGYFAAWPLWVSADGEPTTLWAPDLANQLGLHLRSFLPALALPAATFVLRSQGPVASWLIWRPALYLYVGVGAAAIMSVRMRRYSYLLTVVPVLLHSLALAFVTSGAELRYQYPVYLAGLLMTGVFSCRPSSIGKEGMQEVAALGQGR